MNGSSSSPLGMSCGCPEVYNGQEWVPHCESLDAGALDEAEAAGPEPTGWRCPRCHGPIVRIYLEPARQDPRNPNEFVPLHQSGQLVVRAGYGCRAARCGWSDWVMWIVDDDWDDRRVVPMLP
jgi:hypothetical protein